MVDFIFMLTKADQTVENCLEVFDSIIETGVSHIGFKDVGADGETLAALVKKIRAAGATSYMEVVSTSAERARHSIETAAEIGVERVLGGQDIDFALKTLRSSGAEYYPFPGRPVGHPTSLEGTASDIAADCTRMRAAGCPGVDLLAYRATQSDPLDLVRAARGALGDGTLIVAGSIESPARIQDLATAGADAFTIGTALFDGTFAPDQNSLADQCRAVLASCEATRAHA